jgi:hypothetical protein
MIWCDANDDVSCSTRRSSQGRVRASFHPPGRTSSLLPRNGMARGDCLDSQGLSVGSAHTSEHAPLGGGGSEGHERTQAASPAFRIRNAGDGASASCTGLGGPGN